MQIILLRGLAREAGHWGNFPAALATQTNVDVSCLDLPGFGSEWRRTSPWSIGDISGDVQQRFLGSARSSEPTLLIALSLGAMVALDWAVKYPAGICGLVLINSSARNTAPFWRRIQPRAWPNVTQAILQGPTARERTIARMTTTRAHSHQQNFVDLLQKQPANRRNAFRQMIAASRFQIRTPPRCPALVLVGLGDALVHPACGIALSQLLRADLEKHPTAGHDLPMDDPEWVVDKVHHWMEQRGLTT